jgi:enamine deaminase RidA (YjgF/YER057c/UK114 family)
MPQVEERLLSLGIILPKPRSPVANYVPFVRTGSLIFISGQVSVDADGGICGTVGEDVDMETAIAAARMCGINLLAQMKDACDDDLDRVVRVVKLTGFVQAGPDFFEIPKVVNGCSDLMVATFGDCGKHARTAVGIWRLPLNFAVEVDVVIEVG